MKRFAKSLVPAAFLLQQPRTFFGKGWDNASLDTVFRGLLRKPEVNDRVRTFYAQVVGPRDSDGIVRMGEIARANKTFVRMYLAPHLGDPHRLLKAYSLTAYPILDDGGEQMKVEIDGQMMEAFADPDDDYAKVCIPQLEMVEYLSQQLLEALQWESTPRGAASLLESLYRGAEIPDHVFQTPAVIERLDAIQTPGPK